MVLLVIFFGLLNLIFITSFFSFPINTTLAHLCSYDKSHALMEFKKSLTINSNASIQPYDMSAGQCSPSHPRTNSWHEGEDCCNWDGVTCDITTGQVIGLDLSCSWLKGQLSSNSSLFLLQDLQILNLAFNDFSFSEIPPKLSQFQRLKSLNLSNSFFSGKVPIEISYLSNLVSLDLSTSSFYWSDLMLPRLTMKSLIQNLTMLKQLNLDSVNVSTVEPDSLRNISSSLTSLVLSGLHGIFPTNIFHLPNLQLLYLSGGGNGVLQVPLPTSNGSTTLTELLFETIYFKNELPSSIGNLKSLKSLSIGYSSITRSILDTIGNLTNLKYLFLRDNNLMGTIPPSIAYLTHLEYLDLGYNHLVGTIPLFLAYLIRMQYLDLFLNELVGPIPNLSNLSLLHTIDLSWNSLSGTIPFYMYTFPLLRTLDLHHNQFVDCQLHPFQSRVVVAIDLRGCGLQGPIPAILFPHDANQLWGLYLSNNSLNGAIPSSLFTLPSLRFLYLGNNQLVGRIPEFKSTSLEEIDLSNNKLQGNIPSSILGLVNLTSLYFSSNNLSGMIDACTHSGSDNSVSYTTNVNLNHSLPNLRSFDFSSNNLTDFPVFLRGSKILSKLDLSNNKIDRHVPDWLWDVGRDTLGYLNLAHNSLIGIDKLPWTNLQYIDLQSNLLRGPLPLPPSTMVTYFISNNSITGDIPIFMCNMISMKILDLSRNNFTGTIPECLGNISTLLVLDLSMNKFCGKIPNFSGHKWRSLRTLKLNRNQLEGKLPVSFVNCDNLEVLDMGNNNINDTFPHWLRFITDLQVLVLKSNSFHGYIRDYKYPHSFQKLRIFDVSNNNFVGFLPTKYIHSLEAMKEEMLVDSNYMEFSINNANGSIFSSNYHDAISLTIKGNEIQLEKILTTLMTIDFSKNKFKGEIPQAIGTLIYLKSLNLSYNNLVGHVPASIGNLRNLESLDLSSNKLEGRIPTELASLTFLGKLNLSQNALVGPIPSTNHFDTQFDSSSYKGNSALCGPLLSNKCELEKSPPLLHEEHDDFDKKIILYGYVSGLVIGLSIGYIVFSGEVLIWLVKMVQRYRLRKLK